MTTTRTFAIGLGLTLALTACGADEPSPAPTAVVSPAAPDTSPEPQPEVSPGEAELILPVAFAACEDEDPAVQIATDGRLIDATGLEGVESPGIACLLDQLNTPEDIVTSMREDTGSEEQSAGDNEAGVDYTWTNSGGDISLSILDVRDS